MNTLVVLIWLIIGSDGAPQMFVHPEATMEQCMKDAELFHQNSEADVKTGDIKDFYGACAPVDLNTVSKDKRGSI